MEFKVDFFPDGRLMALRVLKKGSSFREHEDGSYSYCPSEKDIELVKQTYEAISEYNERRILTEYSITRASS